MTWERTAARSRQLEIICIVTSYYLDEKAQLSFEK